MADGYHSNPGAPPIVLSFLPGQSGVPSCGGKGKKKTPKENRTSERPQHSSANGKVPSLTPPLFSMATCQTQESIGKKYQSLTNQSALRGRRLEEQLAACFLTRFHSGSATRPASEHVQSSPFHAELSSLWRRRFYVCMYQPACMHTEGSRAHTLVRQWQLVRVY